MKRRQSVYRLSWRILAADWNDGKSLRWALIMRSTKEIGTHVQMCIYLWHETRVGWKIAEHQFNLVSIEALRQIHHWAHHLLWKVIENSECNWQMKSYTICSVQTNSMCPIRPSVNSFILPVGVFFLNKILHSTETA